MSSSLLPLERDCKMEIYREQVEQCEEYKKKQEKSKRMLEGFYQFFNVAQKEDVKEETAADGWRIVCSLKDENALTVPNYYVISAGRLRSLYKCEIDERIPDIACVDENGTFMWLKPIIIEKKI